MSGCQQECEACELDEPQHCYVQGKATVYNDASDKQGIKLRLTYRDEAAKRRAYLVTLFFSYASRQASV